MKLFATLMLIFFSLSLCGQNDVRDDARKLLEVSNSNQMSLQTLDMMISQVSQFAPNVPDVFWSEFKDEFISDEFNEMVIDIWVKHFTQEEILGLIEFYQSPVGKALIEKQPLVFAEAGQLGQQYGERMGEKIMLRLKSEGYIE